MSFPKIKLAEIAYPNSDMKRYTISSIKGERLSRAKLGKELAESLALASEMCYGEESDVYKIIVAVEKELLKNAEEDML